MREANQEANISPQGEEPQTVNKPQGKEIGKDYPLTEGILRFMEAPTKAVKPLEGSVLETPVSEILLEEGEIPILSNPSILGYCVLLLKPHTPSHVLSLMPLVSSSTIKKACFSLCATCSSQISLGDTHVLNLIRRGGKSKKENDK